MTTYTDADIVQDLRTHVAEYGVRGAARNLGVSPTLVSQVMLGNERPPPKLAHALGYRDDGRRWVLDGPSGRRV